MKKISIKNKKAFIISSIVVIAIILTSLFMIWYFKNNKKITTNMQFEYLGLNEYYENDSNELTINEAGKVLTSVYAKVYDISEIVDTSDGLGLGWQNYAYEMGLISNEEYLNNITYVRLFELIYDYEKTFRNIEENEDNLLNLQEQNLSEQQIYSINYLYNNGIISKDDINKENIQNYVNKLKFEDIIVKCIFKFNLLDLKDDNITYKESLKIMQDRNYFFVTENIDKNVLNKKYFKVDGAEECLMPKQLYKYVRNDISKIENLINGYFNIILNIDNNNISVKRLYNDLKEYALIDYSILEEYVSFVQEKNIKLQGQSKIIYPVIYYIDGYYYIRIIIEYEVISSNTKENILFGNISNGAKYIDVKINKDILGWHISTIDMQNLQLK